MKKVWFLIVTLFASLSLLVACGGTPKEVGTPPEAQTQSSELEAKQAEIDKLKAEKAATEAKAEAEVQAEEDLRIAKQEAKEQAKIDALAEKALKEETMETVYLATLRDFIPSLENAPDETIIELGGAICTDFDKGLSLGNVGQQLLDGGASVNEAGYYIGAAVTAYCPEHQNLLN